MAVGLERLESSAWSNAGSGIYSLEVATTSSYLFPPLDKWSFFKPSPLNFSRQAFTYLRHLDLQLEADYGRDEEEAVKARQVELGQALRLANGLEILTLLFEHDDVEADSLILQRQINVSVLWERFFQDVTCYHLKRLELNHIMTLEPDLASFLRRHSKSLETIIWSNMWLMNGTSGWIKIFRKMKRSMKFETVEFGGLWGGGEGRHCSQKLMKMDDIGLKLAKTILRGPEKHRGESRKAFVSRAEDQLSELLEPGEF